MYAKHFQLKELPFSITPDTAFFMNRANYQDALNILLFALRSGEGFIKVTGEVGTGKTLLCRTLLRLLGRFFVTAYLPNPFLSPRSLYLAIADELGIYCSPSSENHLLLKQINRALIRFHREGKRVVLCLDEAQAMPAETLEALRLITNLETEKRKLLQVVMFGQPELDSLLQRPSVRQIRQRITFSYVLMPLTRAALTRYVEHRLTTAGYHGPKLFSKRALGLIYKTSGGVPRVVNIICHKAMMLAYCGKETHIDLKHVRTAINDSIDASHWQSPRIMGLWTRLRWHYGVFAIITAAAILGLSANVTDVMAFMQ